MKMLLGIMAVVAFVVSCGARTGARCEPYAWTGNEIATYGRRTIFADLDCDGREDTASVERKKAGSDVGLIAIGVRRGGETRELVFDSYSAPEIIDVADLDGDGTLDLLLATRDESVAVDMAVALVGRNGIVLAREAEPTGVYYYDPTYDLECEDLNLLPRIKRLAGGRLTVAWIRFVNEDRTLQPQCTAVQWDDWMVVDGELRRVK